LAPRGFVVHAPQFIAFLASEYRGLTYDRPTLFTARSLDQQPLERSARVRVFHGFGDDHLQLQGKTFTVAREAILTPSETR